MKVEDVKLGMEVLVTDSFQTVNGFTPAGIVGKIRGIMYNDGDMYNDFSEYIVLKIKSDNHIYEVPLEGVQPIITYTPCINDTIKFHNNGDTLSGVVIGIGTREKDYALFVKTDSDFIMISSNQVFEHHTASYYHVSGEKVYD